ncbi:hypothetical protein G7B40_017100 [Aetokthonos hydrillicola Thurmond2011]|uniref:Uncharacterized protein n=1 Tax=Aetokthonos hydrillicola Thurmond2011 TaxID=2712845 RepID=A0AAP5I7R2_9CYAN|nr:hypothetical protein [Aetokthonos hydrillicola]MBO3463703.1 hypothetical protein [Aetokthonos hydrillicola CCALA 1050]MBW4588591.1 hypothetical protein [Aetokthonos hydrillicola CCALA 1050]MDR9896264.1 hypothetical protein [Aetokthonos hydrillicola Thurmond2011]
MTGSGVGGNGAASEFGDLTGFSREEVDDFLQGLGASVKITSGGYVEYKFPDRSKVTIRPNGEVIRTPAPIYSLDGTRINKGLRLDKDGSLLETRDKSNNLIPDTHTTGERLSN